MMTALRSKLMRDDQIMLAVECEGGTVVITLLELSTVLVALTGPAANLGRIRLAARRFHSQYLQHAAVAA